MDRPSILFVNRVYPPERGATGRVLHDLARHFAREGWQVTVIASGSKAGTSLDGAVRVIRVKGPDKPRGAISYFWVLLKMLIAALRLPPTHMLVTMTDPPLLVIAGRIISAVKKNKHIHWCQDLYPDLFPALGVRWPKFLMKFLKGRVDAAMRSCDRVIVIGRCMAAHLRALGRVDANKMTMIPNWADLSLFEPCMKSPDIRPAVHVEGVARAHADQHKHGPKFRVLYAGNLGRAHPISAIIGAAEILQHSHPDVEFVFVGDGRRFERVNEERAKRHLDNIRFLPYQPDSRVRELMESGDVHLVSMRDQAAGKMMPVKVYSAIAAHRPCAFVGPAEAEGAQLISEFGMGRVIPQGDAEGLAAFIGEMRENAESWFAAHEGAKKAATVYVPEESIKAWATRALDAINH